MDTKWSEYSTDSVSNFFNTTSGIGAPQENMANVWAAFVVSLN